jgi:GT2 family glycosyltransferase
MKKLVAMVSIYESGEWIEARLTNLKQSTLGADLEVWCVNANSPDPRDHEIPQQFDFKYIKLDEEKSVYEVWNYIIKESDSQYLTIANTDDLVAPNCYEKLVGALESNKFDFSYCSWYVTDRPGQNYSTAVGLDPNGRPGNYNGDLQRSGVGHFPLWRRNLHQNLGLFDTKFQALADADWWARCYYIANSRFIWINELLAIYLWRHGQNLWHKKISTQEWDRYHQKIAMYKQGKLA